MSPGSSIGSYPAFAHIGLRENFGKNLNQVTCPDREPNPGHLVSRPDAVLLHRDCVKDVAMQRCHIAQLHDGLKCSGKALLHRYQREGDDFLGRIVAMDETWTRSYEPNLKRQSNERKHPGSPRPKKVRPTQSAVKELFIVAYDIDGVILHHAVPPRQTENADYWNIHRTHPI
ncbi:hypothetical protein ANN_14550 [Periplaneta americana]|uniref:Uncharacterized protein n=1 Tax=Periplaneta americana TaxID=6978 RepID=A0ABQ8SXV9_PERAM|nr:hypothetical protein ANN_14550 [Periplaneta americana]